MASWPALQGLTPAAAPGSGPPGRRALLRRGAPLALVTLTNQAQLSADLLVVGWCLGTAAAGNYYLASQIAVAALLFANASNQIALARLPALAHEPARFSAELRAEALRLAGIAIGVAAFLGLAGPTLLPLLFGAEHDGAAKALRWLLPWLLLQHLTTLLQGALTAVRRERAVLGGNLVLLAAMLPALVLAGLHASPAAFAMARATAELARLAALGASLARSRPSATRPITGP
jgi:O-antigen/teichoic acid export membrane protein